MGCDLEVPWKGGGEAEPARWSPAGCRKAEDEVDARKSPAGPGRGPWRAGRGPEAGGGPPGSDPPVLPTLHALAHVGSSSITRGTDVHPLFHPGDLDWAPGCTDPARGAGGRSRGRRHGDPALGGSEQAPQGWGCLTPHEDEHRGVAPERPTSSLPAEPAVTSSCTQRPQARCARGSGTSSSWSPTSQSLLIVLAERMHGGLSCSAHASCSQVQGGVTYGRKWAAAGTVGPPHRSVADAPGVRQAGPEHGPAPPAQNVARANGRLSAPTCPLASQEKARCYGRREERSSQPGGGILQTPGPDVPAGSCGDMPQPVVPTTSLCAKPVAGTPERKRPEPREPPAGSPRARRGSRRRR